MLDEANIILNRHTEIFKKTVSIDDLNSLQKNEAIIINHPRIENLKISLQYDWFALVEYPVIFYSNNIIIRDNADGVFSEHGVELNNGEIIKYIEELFNISDIPTFNYYKILRQKGLKEFDIIIFENGEKGIVIVPPSEKISNDIQYIPLKKDGTKSKSKPKYLYANTNFKAL